MEFLKNNNDNYSKKIKINEYTEGENINKKSVIRRDILEIILENKDIKYNMIEDNEKSTYILKNKLILSEDLDIKYKEFMYSKKFRKSVILKGLDDKRVSYSSLLYYNDIYNINIVIYNLSTKKYYRTGKKNKECFNILYDNNSYSLYEEDENFELGDNSELKYIINMDIDTNDIYIKYLKSLTNYKLCDLVKIAGDNDINLSNPNGKKKTKLELYNEINDKKLEW